jgi:photosystem II stability/assembly factor-like uncharacterized protein
MAPVRTHHRGLRHLLAHACRLGATAVAAGTLLLVTTPALSSATTGLSTLPRAVSCLGPGHCVVVGQWDSSRVNGPLAATTTDGGHHWATHSLPVWLNALWAVSCPTKRFCAAVGDGAVTTTNAGATWTAHRLSSGPAGLVGVSCPNARDCLAVGQDNEATTTDGGTNWESRELPADLQTVSCPAVNVCSAIAIGDTGETLLRTTDGGTEWRAETSPRGVDASDVSCMSVSNCVAVAMTFSGRAQRGAVIATHDGGQSWQGQKLPPGGSGPKLGVWCLPRTGDCTAVGTGVVTTTNWGKTWDLGSAPSDGRNLSAVSCATHRYCMAVGYYLGHPLVITTDNAGRTWSDRPAPAP